MASPLPIFSFVRAPEMFTLIPPSALLQRRKRSPNTRVSSLVIWKSKAFTYHSAVFFGSGAFRWMWLMRKPMALSLTVGLSARALDSVAGARGLRQIDRDDLSPVAVNLVVRLDDHARDLTRDADPFVTREWLLVHVGMEEHATSELLAFG